MNLTLTSIVRLSAAALALCVAPSALAQPPDDWSRAEEIVRAIRLPRGGTVEHIRVRNFTVERAGTVFNGDAPAAAPLRDVTLRDAEIKQADRTFVLKNVEGLKLENVRIGGQRVDGRLEWRQAAP